MVAFDILHKGMKHLLGDLVCPVIIVSVFGEISFDLKINSDSLFVADRLYSGILNGGERVRHNGKSGDSGANQRRTSLSWSAICRRS